MFPGAFKRRHSTTPPKVPGKTLKTSNGDRQPAVYIELGHYDPAIGKKLTVFSDIFTVLLSIMVEEPAETLFQVAMAFKCCYPLCKLCWTYMELTYCTHAVPSPMKLNRLNINAYRCKLPLVILLYIHVNLHCMHVLAVVYIKLFICSVSVR